MEVQNANKANAELESKLKAKLEKEFEQKLLQQEAALKEKLTHQLESDYNEKFSAQKKTLQAEMEQKLITAKVAASEENEKLKKELEQEQDLEVKQQNEF